METTIPARFEPRLMTRFDARAYLRGLDPETIGIAPVPAKSRKVRFDRVEIDSVLNHLSSIVLDGAPKQNVVAPVLRRDAGVLDELLGAHG